jgi:hypothetical protein
MREEDKKSNVYNDVAEHVAHVWAEQGQNDNHNYRNEQQNQSIFHHPLAPGACNRWHGVSPPFIAIPMSI